MSMPRVGCIGCGATAVTGPRRPCQVVYGLEVDHLAKNAHQQLPERMAIHDGFTPTAGAVRRSASAGLTERTQLGRRIALPAHPALVAGNPVRIGGEPVDRFRHACDRRAVPAHDTTVYMPPFAWRMVVYMPPRCGASGLVTLRSCGISLRKVQSLYDLFSPEKEVIYDLTGGSV